MNLFKIETGVKRQGSEIKDQGSGVRGQGSVVNCEAGFTIVELIVVLAIMSILVGMAYSALRTPNEKIACQYIYSKMNLAKMRAVSGNTGVSWSVDVDDELSGSNFWDLTSVTWGQEVAYQTSVTFALADPGISFPSNGIDFDSGPGTSNIIYFSSKGMAEDGSNNSTNGSVYIYNVESSNRICAVIVRTTGLIKMRSSSDGGNTWN